MWSSHTLVGCSIFLFCQPDTARRCSRPWWVAGTASCDTPSCSGLFFPDQIKTQSDDFGPPNQPTRPPEAAFLAPLFTSWPERFAPAGSMYASEPDRCDFIDPHVVAAVGGLGWSLTAPRVKYRSACMVEWPRLAGGLLKKKTKTNKQIQIYYWWLHLR